jgi:hypothetical protein
VVGHFSGNRTRTQSFTARPGGSETIALETPPEAPAPRDPNNPADNPAPHGSEQPGSPSGPSAPVTPAPPSSRGGISPAVFITGAVLTAGLAGALIWSGTDTLAGVPAYQMNPTPDALAEGQARELRTNVLIGATAVVGAATLTTLFFTRWTGGRIEAAPAVAGAAGAAPGLTFRGSF